MPATQTKDWISRRAVARELQIDDSSVPAVIFAAQIRVQRLPGLAPRYSREDVARIKTESVTTLAEWGGR